MKYQNSYSRYNRRITTEDLKNNRKLRKFYNIVRFSRILRIVLGVLLILLIIKVGV